MHLSKLKRKSSVLFGGKFKVPICEGIAPGATHVICISTGVGVGPVYGFAQEEMAVALPQQQQQQQQQQRRRVSIFAGFRDVRDIAMQEEMEELAGRFPEFVRWVPCVSSLRDDRYPLPMGFEGLRGRVTDAVPQVP